MRLFNLLTAAVLCTMATMPALGQAKFVAPAGGTIGRNLEAFTNISVIGPPPQQTLAITISSDDPSRLLIAAAADVAGAKTLTLSLSPGRSQTTDFYLQAVGEAGAATYTVTAPGFEKAQGTIQIARSAILIATVSKSLILKTTKGEPRRIIAYTAVLDEAGNTVDQQPIAGGLSVKVGITSSDEKVGSVSSSPLVLNGGMTSVIAEFKPSAPGTAVLTSNSPNGFQPAPKSDAIAVTVTLPGLAVLGEITVGKNLEVLGYVLLGEDAPAGGLDVTLTSEDPTRLLLSASGDTLGSKTLTLHVPAGEGRAPYYIQGMAESGTVNYTGTANGYHSRPTPIALAPSGLMVVFAPYGPPDEGEFLKPMPRPNDRPLFASLSDNKPLWLTIWPVYLDPTTRRGADITAQRLRPGLSVKVDLANSNPAVAKVDESVTLTTKTVCAFAQFHPLKVGQTVVSINTPPDFITPSNATSVTASVRE